MYKTSYWNELDLIFEAEEWTFAPIDFTIGIPLSFAGFSPVATGKPLFANIDGTAGDDVLDGTADADTINGLGGNDIINGLGGDDIIDGGAGDNTLNGGAGNDTITSLGNDIIEGGTGDDLVEMGLASRDDTTLIDGGADTDTISFATLDAAEGGGAANSFLVVDLQAQAYSLRDLSTLLFVDQFANFENVTGSDFRDLLQGSSGDNVLSGLAGDDTLQGRGGNDIINGGYGDDVINGGIGADIMNGGAGIDTLSYAGSATFILINLRTGTAGGAAAGDSFLSFEIAIGTDFNDIITGTFGNNVLTGGLGNDTLNGSTGIDTAVYISGNIDDYVVTEISANQYTVTSQNGAVDGVDTLIDIETIRLGGVNGADYDIGALARYALNPTALTEGADTYTGTGVDEAINALGGDDIINTYGGDDIIFAGTGDDIINPGTGDDIIYGGAGNDTVSYVDSTIPIGVNLRLHQGAAGDLLYDIENVTGGAFSDGIRGTDGNNVLRGLDGDDQLRGRDGDDVLYGGNGDDLLFSGLGNNVLYGGGGDDFLSGGSGYNILYGGDGNDRLAGSLNDLIFGEAGDDIFISSGGGTIDGGTGNDTIEYTQHDIANYVVTEINPDEYTITVTFVEQNLSRTHTVVNVEFIRIGVRSRNEIYSIADVAASPGPIDLTLGQDVYNGTALFDIVNGLDGDDEINGFGGNDSLRGDGGNDTLNGGDGNDFLYGGAGDDILNGGNGADTIYGGDGFDWVTYQDADQALDTSVFRALGDEWFDIEGVIGSNFDDILSASFLGVYYLDGGGGNDTLAGGSGNIIFYGGAGDDNFYAGGGDDIIDGGSGNDVAIYSHSSVADYNVTRTAPGEYTIEAIGASAFEGIDTLTGIETIRLGGRDGTDYDIEDLVTAGLIFLTENDDVYSGTELVNVVHALGGDDAISGLGGDDILNGGAGADALDGGVGNDTADYAGAGGVVRADLQGVVSHLGDAVGDTFVSIENLSGSDFNDRFYGDAANNILSGHAGNDALFGRNGDDTLLGGAGNDFLIGGSGNDIQDGGDGDDQVHGNSGNDILSGGAGNDFLTGGGGADTFDGGDGIDRCNILTVLAA